MIFTNSNFHTIVCAYLPFYSGYQFHTTVYRANRDTSLNQWELPISFLHQDLSIHKAYEGLIPPAFTHHSDNNMPLLKNLCCLGLLTVPAHVIHHISMTSRQTDFFGISCIDSRLTITSAYRIFLTFRASVYCASHKQTTLTPCVSIHLRLFCNDTIVSLRIIHNHQN